MGDPSVGTVVSSVQSSCWLSLIADRLIPSRATRASSTDWEERISKASKSFGQAATHCKSQREFKEALSKFEADDPLSYANLTGMIDDHRCGLRPDDDDTDEPWPFYKPSHEREQGGSETDEPPIVHIGYSRHTGTTQEGLEGGHATEAAETTGHDSAQTSQLSVAQSRATRE